MSTLSEVRPGTIGIIGAGKSGAAIARLALDAGYAVKIASSGTAKDTALITGIISPGAVAVDTADLGNAVDLLCLAVPLRRFQELPLPMFSGKVVIDVMNYWPPVDGKLPEYEGIGRPTSAILQEAIPEARVVKTFNHLGYHQMEDLARGQGAPDRIALGIAGNDTAAVGKVMDFVDAVGFDPVYIGMLEQSRVLQPEAPIFGAALSSAEIQHKATSTASQQSRKALDF